MATRFVFAGFRHGHIETMYAHVSRHRDLEIVAACEDDPPTRDRLTAAGSITLTHDNIDQMLREVDCDVVAVGDYYARRGSLVIKALQAGKHVLCDKPVCVTSAELDQIEALAKAQNLCVGAMLDMRDVGAFITAHACIRKGDIGDIVAVNFGGQHPLMPQTRPGWYFEPGKHGGTINDIAIHAIDLIPWICGVALTRVEAARCWNALATEAPHMKDAAQMMLTMENGAGVLGDVSYAVPDSLGYSHPWYWRFTFWGSQGVLEASATDPCLRIVQQGDKQPREIPCAEPTSAGYLRDFLAELKGTLTPGGLDTATVIAASRKALAIQAAADEGLRSVPLGP